MDPVVLILAIVAGVIIFRLISVMGTRTGHEQQHDIEALQRAARGARAEEPASVPSEVDRPAPKPVSTNARTLRDADPDFDEAEFLKGAQGAYEMIVEAFVAGDLRSIRPFIDDSVYDAFKAAIVSRENASHSADLKFVGIDHAAIISSNVTDARMTATVDFASNQVRVTRDSDGAVVDGDPNRIDLVKDRWTFSRDIASNDPNWVLVGTGGSA